MQNFKRKKKMNASIHFCPDIDRWRVPVTSPSLQPSACWDSFPSPDCSGGKWMKVRADNISWYFWQSFEWNLTSWLKCELSPESHRPTRHLTWFHSQRPQLHHSSFMAVAVQFSTAFMSKLEKNLPTSENTLGMSGCDISIAISCRSDFEVFISKRLRQTRLHGHVPWFLFVLENKTNFHFYLLPLLSHKLWNIKNAPSWLHFYLQSDISQKLWIWSSWTFIWRHSSSHGRLYRCDPLWASHVNV